ncbi:MAG: LPXTG cell wall anchor domain-containing protein [Cellulomonadaceae bacterium]|nr:LPXTG cell wall anchor domain-containing protein [Cellulomonadaceae bacterium]
MITHSPPRRTAALMTALAVAAAALLAPPGPASAADGAAPEPHTYRVIGGVHTDAVSTFLDDGQLALASKADVAEGNGTRFGADDIWLHLDHSAQTTVPTGYEFIAVAGSTIWLASESNPGTGKLWPGFSTESVPSSAIDADATTFTLTGVDGPGDLEVFTGGGFGGPTRLWSSRDASVRTFEVGRTHMHANWAFTAAGTYRVAVQAAVTIDGAPQTSNATYTFVVGDLPAATGTTTTLSATATELTLGDETSLEATVAPATVDGYVEFRDGATVVGHERVAGGTARITLDGIGLGAHPLTASFVPTVLNLATGSTSAPVTVTVTDETGTAFGIGGIAPSYLPGDTLDAHVVGHTLADGQTYRWTWRPIGAPGALVFQGGGSQSAAGVISVPMDASYDGYEMSVALREGSTTVTQSAWVRLSVHNAVEPLSGSFPTGAIYLGDDARLTLSGRALTEGETVRLAYRFASTPWTSAASMFRRIDDVTLQFLPPYDMKNVAWVVQVVRDELVVAQSAPFTKSVASREVLVEGIQSVYRTGQTLRATASVYPKLDGLVYRWSLRTAAGTAVIQEGSAASDLSIEIPLTLEHHNARLTFAAIQLDQVTGSTLTTGSTYSTLKVSESDPDAQLLLFQNLSAHYHQGSNIALSLVADPALADGDTVTWEWRWPEQGWKPLPRAEGLSHTLVAEQALNGVQVRASVSFADGGGLTNEPVTILVDDHGADPSQKITISGLAAHYHSGDPIELASAVNPASVLDRWEWYVQKVGATIPMLVKDENGPTLSFAATSEYDGAAVFSTLTYGDGRAYVESAPVLLEIDDHHEEPVPTTLTISGLADHYRTGQAMTLRVSQAPDTGEDHWHWFIKPAGADQYVMVPGQLTSTLTRTVAAVDDAASIIVRLYDHDHEVIAESGAVIVSVDDHGEGTDPGGSTGGDVDTGGGSAGGGSGSGSGSGSQPISVPPTGAPAARTGGDLGSTPPGGLSLGSTKVTPGQVVTIGLGSAHANEWVGAWMFSTPTLLNGGWTQASGAGDIAVRVPSDAEAGTHRLAVFAADGSLLGWESITAVVPTDTSPGSTVPTGTLPQTGGAVSPAWLGAPVLLMGLGALLLTMRRRRLAI